MVDLIEAVRQQTEQAANAQERARLEATYGQVWDKDQLRQDFEVLQFAAPMVIVTRRADGVRGTIYFTHMPRFYYSFQPASK